MTRLLLAVTLSLAWLGASAQQRPLRVLVPFSAGGASDTYSRLAALKITEQTGRTIVVENRTGAGGRISWEAVAKSAPDGTTAGLIAALFGVPDKLVHAYPVVDDTTYAVQLHELGHTCAGNGSLAGERSHCKTEVQYCGIKIVEEEAAW